MTSKIRKVDLPAKSCARCGRPFTWRKKWSRDWESVKYCSRRCSGARSALAAPTPTGKR